MKINATTEEVRERISKKKEKKKKHGRTKAVQRKQLKKGV